MSGGARGHLKEKKTRKKLTWSNVINGPDVAAAFLQKASEFIFSFCVIDFLPMPKQCLKLVKRTSKEEQTKGV